MDNMQIVLAVLLVIMLTVLVVMIVKAVGARKKTPVIEPPRPPVYIPAVEVTPPELQEPAPDIINIYSYSPVTRVKTCPFCDGENHITAIYCGICGKQTEG